MRWNVWALVLLMGLSNPGANGSASLITDELGQREKWQMPGFVDSNQAASRRYWVFFTDKGVYSRSGLHEAAEGLTQSGVHAGRTRDLDAFDLPVRPRYIQAVEATGATIHTSSRWLNAVSVKASAQQLNRIAALNPVAGIQPVALGRRGPLPDGSEKSAGVGSSARFLVDYGPSLQQSLSLLVPELHALGLSGRDVRIAILDTGFKLTHDALGALTSENRVLDQWDFVHGDSSVANDSLDTPGQDHHGTEVLGTMAGLWPGQLVGPAFGSEYLLAKTEDNAGETPVEEDNYVAALEWADSLGAHILNSSLSYDFGYTMNGAEGISTVAANTAASRGIVLVTSMGNTGPLATSLGAPADAFDIVAVGAVDATGTIAGFSSRGPTADGRTKPAVVAQGVSVYTVDPTADAQYVSVNGTSFSAPLTAASAALLREAHPDWSALMVREALMASGDLSAAPNSTYGWGQFDLLRALDFQPQGALVLDAASISDRYDLADWDLDVHLFGADDRLPIGVTAFYQRDGGTRDSLALGRVSDSLWTGALGYAGEETLSVRFRTTDSALRVAWQPPDTLRHFEYLRNPQSLAEGFEAGALRWRRGGSHDLFWPSSASPHTGSFALSDSPVGSYPDNADAWFETHQPLVLSTGGIWGIRFLSRHQLGFGDSALVEWRTNSGAWQPAGILRGTESVWTEHTYLLSGAAGDSVDIRLRLVSDGAGAGDGWHIDELLLTPAPNSVDSPGAVKPAGITLHHAYPNPFNGQTTLRLDLDRPGHVQLTVFDITGRQVRVLRSGRMEAGPHRMVWDGRDFAGHPVASGVYLVRLEIHARRWTRKLVLIK